MSDNHEFEFFNKTEKSFKTIANVHGEQPIDNKFVAHLITAITIGLVIALWILMSSVTSNMRVTKPVHPYYNPPIQQKAIPPVSEAINMPSAAEVGKMVEQIKNENSKIEAQKSQISQSTINEKNNNSPFIGDMANVKQKNLDKAQEFNNKLMKNEMSQKDIQAAVDNLNQIQKDYYKNKSN